jgi:hypothetical protein
MTLARIGAQTLMTMVELEGDAQRATSRAQACSPGGPGEFERLSY